MRLVHLCRPALGSLVLLSALAFTPAGVRVVRAEAVGDAERSVSLRGGQCRVDDAAPARPAAAPRMAEIVARLQEQMLAAGGEGRALNMQGLNYRTAEDPALQLRRIEAEARMQRQGR